jgi:glycosyltransferase involved in cell wall biosynthesis
MGRGLAVTSRSWGGNEKWALGAASSLAARGHRVAVLWSHEPVRRALEARGLPGRRVRLPGDLNPVSFASLARALRAERPDAVVLTTQREYWVGGVAARLAGRPLVALRLGLRRRPPDDLKRRLSFGRLSDLVIANSREISEMLRAVPWFDHGKVRVLMNGVETSPVDRAEGRRLVESLGVPPGARAVVAAGRLARMKGFDVLIRAFRAVLDAVPDARLVLLGEGGRRRELEDEAARAGVAGAVVFAGHRTDVREVLAGADVFALPSRNEGMANALLEAMSVGAPIVATAVSGTGEAVRDGEDALVVAPEDEEALAAAVVRLLRDRELAARLGASAASRAAARFTYERMAEEIERMLVEALDRAAAERPGLT